MRFATRFLALILPAAGLLAFAPPAQAGIITSKPKIIPIPDPVFLWEFEVFLEAGTEIRFNDYFTVYDIPGLIPGSNSQLLPNKSTPNPLWAAAFNFSGVTPDFPDPSPVNDDRNLLNITWRYLGAVDIIKVPAGLDKLLIGYFYFVSESEYDELPATVQLASETTDPRTGGKVPSYQVVQTRLIPEPSTMAMLTPTAALLGVMWWRRRRAA